MARKRRALAAVCVLLPAATSFSLPSVAPHSRTAVVNVCSFNARHHQRLETDSPHHETETALLLAKQENTAEDVRMHAEGLRQCGFTVLRFPEQTSVHTLS